MKPRFQMSIHAFNSHKPSLPTMRTFFLGCAGVGSALLAQRALMQAQWGVGAFLFALGAVCWVWADRQTYAPDSATRRFVGGHGLMLPAWEGARRRVGMLLLAIAGGCAVAAIGLAVWNWRTVEIARPTDSDWYRYGASVGLALLAVLLLEPWRNARSAVDPGGRASHSGSRHPLGLTALILMGIVALAAVVRLVNLDTLPFGVWYDEAANSLEALRVLREPAYRPFYTDGVNATGHYLLLIAAMMDWFGVDVWAIRFISALMGIATVIAAYHVGRELHSPTLGLALAFLVAVARWSITFSRLGMYNAATPLFELLVLAWLLRGLRRGSALDFGLAGIALGLGLCFYSAFQLFLVVIAVGGVWLAWRERRYWTRIWSGAGITIVMALLVIAPVVQYAMAHPDSYFARVQKTSLFADKAPEERLPALWQNARKHLLMFNVNGDPNGRHNLPGAPMLDWVSGGLLVLGLAGCLARPRDPAAVLGPVWLVVGLMGGILSLDFEAPQSLRSIGAQPAVLLLVAWPIAGLDRLWRADAGRFMPQLGIGLATVALLLPAAGLNLHTYFVRQANDFSAWNVHSTSESVAARLLRDLEPGVEAYMVALFDGHPTVRFLAQDAVYRRIETNATLPIARATPGGLLLILDVERRALFEQAKRLYPEAEFTEVHAPFGGPPTLLTARISVEQVQSIQGLTVAYRVGDGDNDWMPESPAANPSGPQVVDVEWRQDAPLPIPFEAEWSGVLAIGIYGRYQFFVEAPGHTELSIGEAQVLAGDATGGLAADVVMARGFHNLRLRATGGAGRVRLAWQPPDGPPATIPAWALYHDPVRSNGLLGRYYANGEWAGEPALAQIDPHLGIYFHVPVLPRPYTVEWSGKLAAPVSGRYGFALRSIDESVLIINGDVIAASEGRNVTGRASLDLEEGLHDIVVRFGDRTNHTNINLYWLPPGSASPEAYQIIPTDFLLPPQADYSAVDVADLARFLSSATQIPAQLAAEWVDPATVAVALDGLVAPRGVTVRNGVVYVADGGAGRLVAYDPVTATSWTVVLAGQRLAEPFDLDVHPDGRLVVLDATAATVLLIDPDAGEVTEVPLPQGLAERSRGIGVGRDGLIWIANTAGRRVVAVDLQGMIVHELSPPPATDGSPHLQPVDVAPLADGSVVVTDVGGHQLLRFSQEGFLLQGYAMPVANSLDGPHLAVTRPVRDDAETPEYVVITHPEAGQVVMLDPAGHPAAVWSVRTAATATAKPVGIAVDTDGLIWLADSEGGRLLRLEPQE